MTSTVPAAAGPGAYIIELPPGEVGPSALQRNLNLTRELAVTAFKLRYAGSWLGYLWSLIKPLMIFGMLYVVFAFFLLRGRTNANENFPVQLLLGIVLWTFFADATAMALQSVVMNSQLVVKTYFPRWIVVIAATASAGITLVLNLTILAAVGLPLHWLHLSWASLAFPLVLLELYAIVIGCGLLLASLFVSFRDLTHVWEIVAQFLFYSSAIVFPFSLLPAQYSWLVALNPMAQLIEDARRSLVTSAIPWSETILGWKLALPLVAVVILVSVGAFAFSRLARHFGEVL